MIASIKTIIVIVITILLLPQNAVAQKNRTAFQKDKSYVSLAYALPIISVNSIFNIYAKYAGFNTSVTGPIRFNYEYGYSNKVGIGLNMGYTSGTISFHNVLPDSFGHIYSYSYQYSKISVVPRINYHMASDKKIDPYIGIGLGFKKVLRVLDTDNPNFKPLNMRWIPIAFEATIGCRFLFKPNVGAYVEIGAGHGFAQFGVVGKF